MFFDTIYLFSIHALSIFASVCVSSLSTNVTHVCCVSSLSATSISTFGRFGFAALGKSPAISCIIDA